MSYINKDATLAAIAQKAKDELADVNHYFLEGVQLAVDVVEGLPSAQPKSYREGYQAGFKDAQPERMRGKWIEDDDGWDGIIWRCSECDAVFALTDGTPEENEYNFCPHCGTKMEVDDERPD